jgi:ribokinase
MTSSDWLPSFPARRPRIAAIGLATWDRLMVVDRFPDIGGYGIVRTEFSGPGGTTSNSAAALAKLRAEVSIRALVGDDREGSCMKGALESLGVDTTWLTTVPGELTDAGTIIVSADPPDRTIFWHQGARLVQGDQIDIAALFANDVVLVDVDDPRLRRFLVDLPAHTLPSARLLGTLTYLEESAIADGFELLMRHDAVIGNARQFQSITRSESVESVIEAVRGRMRGENLRTAIVTLGPGGSLAFTIDELWESPGFPVKVVDPTGAGDAFAGAVAFGMACRWGWGTVLRFANAVAALTTRALGAQTAQPTWDETIAFLNDLSPSTI